MTKKEKTLGQLILEQNRKVKEMIYNNNKLTNQQKDEIFEDYLKGDIRE